MVMALKEDKRTGVATGLSEKFSKNPDYYARNFLVGLGSHTMPVFLFKGEFKKVLTFVSNHFLLCRYFTRGEERICIPEEDQDPGQQDDEADQSWAE